MTSSDHWREIKALFDQAVEIPPGERSAWVAARCADRADLRAELESLLASHDDPHPVFGAPLLELAYGERPPARLQAGEPIGAYRVTRLIGEGGMGTVYAAVRSDGAFEKEVAIKLIERGLHSEDVLRRFRSERQVLATLDHPNIATLLDGGTTAAARPYLVMEYVAGAPIDAYCRQQSVGLDDRLRLFLCVCSAVAHAHERLVVHRDLKPDNVLVGADGQPKLLDFGIAKLLDADGDTSRTMTGYRPMTPLYASPEQVRGEPIGTSTDVYSLGVLLFLLLTDQLPYANPGASPPDLARAICEESAPRPSDVAIGTLARRVWTRQLRGDLDAIAQMALRKEPNRRYRSVDHLADDVRNHLEGLVVAARPDTLHYRARTFARRNPFATVAGGIAALSLVAGIVATSWMAIAARHEAARAQRLVAFFSTMIALPDPSWYAPSGGGPPDMTVMDLLKQTGERIDRELGTHPDLAADLHHTLGNTFRAKGQSDDAEAHFSAALTMRRQVFGERHAKVAESLYFLGATKLMKGKPAEAETLIEQAIAIERELPAPDGNAPYMVMDLSGMRRVQGRLREAEQLGQEARRMLGRAGDVKAIAFATQHLAWIRFDLGDLAGAKRMFQEVVDTWQQPPTNAIALAEGLHGLASALAREESAEAEAPFREALALFIAGGAPKNRVAAIYGALAGVLMAQHRYREAEAAAREAIGMLDGRSGERWPIESFHSLGLALAATGRTREGEGFLRRAVEEAEKHRSTHPCVAGMVGARFALWLRDHDRPIEGTPLLDRSTADIRAHCPPEAFETQHALHDAQAVPSMRAEKN